MSQSVRSRSREAGKFVWGWRTKSGGVKFPTSYRIPPGLSFAWTRSGPDDKGRRLTTLAVHFSRPFVVVYSVWLCRQGWRLSIARSRSLYAPPESLVSEVKRIQHVGPVDD
jgi:hypothetical protein